MERFDTLFEKNLPEKGGSFYIQSKVYYAKEFLMQDYATDLNQSPHNPGAKPTDDAAEDQKTEEKNK